jgi:hypothetical protein
MSSLGATGGPRSFRIDDRWVDILGQVERMSKAPYQSVKTAYGVVTLMPVEELLVDRVFTSVYPQENDEAKACAEKLMAVCIRGNVPVDWPEAAKMAGAKEYGIGKEFEEFKKTVSKQIYGPNENNRPKGSADMGRVDGGSQEPEINI